jgi:hypothetical protein
MLYHHPANGVKNWSVPFNQEQLRTLKSKVGQWDIDAYLPLETSQWCQMFLDSIQFNSSRNIGDRTKPFFHSYMRLRNAITTHVRSKRSPELSLLPPPTGAFNWEPSISEEESRVRSADLETDWVWEEELSVRDADPETNLNA